MNKKAGYILLVVLIIIAAAVFFSAVNKANNSSDAATVNENIIESKAFSVNSDSAEMNTSARGTVFIKGNEKISEHVHIIAWIEIDPNDWGGVVFYIPAKWHISSIISSYPENEAQAVPADYVATWNPADPEHEWSAMIEVGRDRSYMPTGGGTGVVVIDLVPDQNVKIVPETFKMMVGVGSQEKDGVKIMSPDHITVEIPISLTDKE